MGKKEDYPIVLSPKHVAEIMGIKSTLLYEIMQRKDFPLIDIGSTAKKIHRDKFFEWLDNRTNTGT